MSLVSTEPNHKKVLLVRLQRLDLAIILTVQSPAAANVQCHNVRPINPPSRCVSLYIPKSVVMAALGLTARAKENAIILLFEAHLMANKIKFTAFAAERLYQNKNFA